MKMNGNGFRAAALIGAAALALAFAGETRAQNQNSNGNWNTPSNGNTWPYAPTGKSPVLAVVGDVACQPDEVEPPGEAAHEVCGDAKPPYTSTSLWESQEATANQIEAMKPDLVALVGDLQYQVGEYSDFEQSFNLTYGGFKFLHRPAPGNHEFYDEHSQTGVAGYGYFSYYNGFQIDANGNPITATISDPCPPANAAICNYPGLTTPIPQPVPRPDGQAGHFDLTNGPTNGIGNGWYSYNLGSWHLISLNIECGTQPGGCSTAPGTWLAAELSWLKNDLEENHASCTLAYWHQPTFSGANSITTEGITAQAFWQLLYAYRADLVLNGHDHLYARYRPLNPSGKYDPRNGIREFIVGTGGETLDTVVNTGVANTSDPSGNPNFNAQNMEMASGDFWGAMALTLNPNGYTWNFQTALEKPGDGAGPFSDTGFGTCHGGRGDGGWQDGNNQGQNQN
jgi:acid phosphatase type 7